MTKKPRHRKVEIGQYTPPEVYGPTFGLLGRPSLDVASSEAANRCLIGAKRYYAQSGLDRPWLGRHVWCHPPWEEAWKWWCRGAGEWQAGHAGHLVFFAYDVLILLQATRQSRAAGVPTPRQAARVRFTRPVRYMRESRTLPLFPGEGGFEHGDAPVCRSALLLLSDDPRIVRAWIDAYARGALPCETAMPCRIPVREARLWPIEQVSFL